MPLVERDPASYTDPNGYVYWQDGQVFRRIYPEKAPFIAGLLENPTVARLIADGKLVGTRVADSDEPGLLLAHDTIWPRSYPHEWCSPMLREAGALIVDVTSALGEAGYALADGHPWNVLFHRGKPVFIDVGSIVEAHPALPWPALAQFNRFVRYPLHLYGAGLPELARARLQDLALGVSADLAMRALPASYKWRHPLVTAKLRLNVAAEAMADSARAGAAAGAKAREVAPEMMRQIRQGFFASLRAEVTAIAPAAKGAWVSYYANCPSMAEADAAAKATLMERVLDELAPQTVLDLGANTGQYAMMAARKGARVVALDQDEPSVAALYRASRQENLDVLPLVMDLGNPSPANGWCASQRPDALTRFQSDAALMLALIHHLVFTANASLAQVAQLAGRASKRHVVLEWVAPEDAMSVHLRRTATKDFSFYTLDNMVAALEAEGFAVKALEPHSATRRLLVGSRRGA